MTPYRHRIAISWGDCDPAKIVYTGRIPWFALEAINGWWVNHTGCGWYELELDQNLGLPFVRMELDFRAPVTPRHPLFCDVWPNLLGETSVGFRVRGNQDGEVCFEGSFVSVFVVADRLRKRPPPDDIRALVQSCLVPDA